MKLKHIFSIFAVLTLPFMMPSCTPDDIDMPQKNIASGDLVEGIAYTVTADAANPNIIYLDSKMPTGYTVYWEHPQGRCQDSHVELHLPFEGEYTVRFGVETRGGIVYGDPVTFTINTFCADFVTDELWTYLTGGVGKSKEWIYDDGSYGYMPGELSYGDPSANPNFGWKSFTSNWDPGKGHCGDDAMFESVMTFDLINGANYSFYNSTTGVTQVGLFSVNTENHTLSFTDADLMHPDAWNDRLPNWRTDLRIIELDANHMRVGYIRQSGNWGGEWIEVFNYVSKEYADNYVPPVITEEPVPVLDAVWYDTFLNQCKYASWTLDNEVPFDWCALDGTRKNLISGPADYPEGFTPLEFETPLTIKFTSPSTTDYKVTMPDGNSVSGKFSATPEGIISFTDGVGSTLIAGTSIFFTANEDNTLRVLSYELDDLGRISDLWLGNKQYDIMGKSIEYIGYHFVANYGGGKEEVTYKTTLNFNNTDNWTMVTGDAVYATEGTFTATVNVTWSAGDPCLWLDVNNFLRDHPNGDIVITGLKVDGVAIPFVDADISRGAGDDPNTARRYICNPWGLAPCFSSLDIFHPTTGVEVTFNVIYDNGTPFVPAEE